MNKWITEAQVTQVVTKMDEQETARTSDQTQVLD